MGNVASTGGFSKHLDRRIQKIYFDALTSAPVEFTKIAKIETKAPPGKEYRCAELSPLGGLQLINEGQPITYDVPVEGHEVAYVYYKYGLGFQITEEMYKDDLTQNFMKVPAKLAKSASIKTDTVFFDLFNSGFTTHTCKTGQYIFDTDHTTLKNVATVANTPATAGSLSETTLQAAFEYFDNLTDQAGNPIVMNPKLLLVPTELRFTAKQLMKNGMTLDSGNNNLNLLSPENGEVSYGTHVSRFLTSSTAWFLLAEEHDFRIVWKQNASLKSWDDPTTGNACWGTKMRFAAFCYNYEGAYGNAGA